MNASPPVPSLSISLLSDATFDRFRALIHEKTGIHMREGKQILVSNRLRRRIVHLKLASYEEYYELLTASRDAAREMPHFIDAVSTNETYFFREGNHFTALSRVVLLSCSAPASASASGARAVPRGRRSTRCASWWTRPPGSRARPKWTSSAPTSARR